jgi:hypothetical protein
MPCDYKQYGDEDQHAKLLGLRGQHYEDLMDEVHEVVQGALHTTDRPWLCFWNVLLEKLGHKSKDQKPAGQQC